MFEAVIKCLQQSKIVKPVQPVLLVHLPPHWLQPRQLTQRRRLQSKQISFSRIVTLESSFNPCLKSARLHLIGFLTTQTSHSNCMITASIKQAFEQHQRGRARKMFHEIDAVISNKFQFMSQLSIWPVQNKLKKLV